MIIKFKKPGPVNGYFTTENPNPFYRIHDLWCYVIWRNDPKDDWVVQLDVDIARLSMTRLIVDVNGVLDYCDDFTIGEAKIYELFQTCRFTDKEMVLENYFPLLIEDKRLITNQITTTFSLHGDKIVKDVKFTIQGARDIHYESLVETPRRKEDASFLSSLLFSFAVIYLKCTVKEVRTKYVNESRILYDIMLGILYKLREFYLRNSTNVPVDQLPLCLKNTGGGDSEIEMVTLTPGLKGGKSVINIIKGKEND